MRGLQTAMSVPVNQRSESKLEVCVQAHDLCCYTLQITSNKKNFPEEFQHSLTDKIVDTAIDNHTLVWSANNILVNSKEDYAARHRLQEQAAVKCNVLLSLLEVAKRVYHLSTKRVAYWSGKVVRTRELIRGWRDKDKQRYQAKFG